MGRLFENGVYATTSPEEAVEYTFSTVLSTIPDLSKAEIDKQFSSLQNVWASKKLFEGSEFIIKHLILTNLTRISEQVNFESFNVKSLAQESCVLIQGAITEPRSFIPVRIWKMNLIYFACGNAKFEDSEIVEGARSVSISNNLSETLSENTVHDFFGCIAANNIDDVRSMLTKSPLLVNSIDQNKQTALHRAAMNERTEICKLLIDKGGNLEALDKDSCTPLHIAIYNTSKGDTNHENIKERLMTVQLLVENGANINAKDAFGFSPLHAAASRAKSDLIQLLIDKGANIHATTNSGSTPLHIAAQAGWESPIKLLVSLGADVKALNNNNKTPSQMAYDSNFVFFSKMLKKMEKPKWKFW